MGVDVGDGMPRAVFEEDSARDEGVNPATPAPRHERLFPSAQVPRGPSFNEEDVSDKPAPRSKLSGGEIEELDALYRSRLRPCRGRRDDREPREDPRRDREVGVQAELSSLTRALASCAGAACRAAESVAPP